MPASSASSAASIAALRQSSSWVAIHSYGRVCIIYSPTAPRHRHSLCTCVHRMANPGRKVYIYDPEHEKYRPWKKRTTWLRVRSYSTTLAGLKAELIARGFVSERRRCSLGVKRAGEWWYESECPQLPNEDYIFVQVVYHRKNRKGRMRGVSGPRPPPDTGPLDDLLDTLTTMTFSIFSQNVPGAPHSAPPATQNPESVESKKHV